MRFIAKRLWYISSDLHSVDTPMNNFAHRDDSKECQPPNAGRNTETEENSKRTPKELRPSATDRPSLCVHVSPQTNELHQSWPSACDEIIGCLIGRERIPPINQAAAKRIFGALKLREVRAFLMIKNAEFNAHPNCSAVRWDSRWDSR